MTDFSGGDDPILKELLPGYLARRRDELAILDDAVANQDFSRLRTIGHNLRGSGGAYGLPRISELGETLEFAAIADDADTIRATIAQIRVFLDAISI